MNCLYTKRYFTLVYEPHCAECSIAAFQFSNRTFVALWDLGAALTPANSSLVLPTAAEVSSICFAGDQGAPHRLGVQGWHAVAQRPDPHTPRQRANLFLYHLQPHN